MYEKIVTDTDALNTREKILHMARREFFDKGFANANVRAIAELAGVTTGALYHFFKNKDDLFDVLVGNVFDEFLNLIMHTNVLKTKEIGMKTDELSVITEVSQVRFLRMVDFFYDNWDAMKLIICCSKGSSYEHIFDKAIELVENETIRLLKLDDITISRRRHFFVHVMVSAHFENLKEIFYHDLKKKEAVEYVLDFNAYHCAGWKQYWMDQVN
jgi:transcriptional regulator, tetR family